MTLSVREYGLGPIRRDVADRWLSSDDPRKVMYALLRLSLNGPDFAFAERKALENASHPDVWVRINVTNALLHVARLHGSIDLPQVMRTLLKLCEDPEMGGEADSALDGVEHYMKTDRRLFMPAPAEPALQRAGT